MFATEILVLELQALAGWRWFTERQRLRQSAANKPLARAWRGWVAVAAHCRHVREALDACCQRRAQR